MTTSNTRLTLNNHDVVLTLDDGQVTVHLASKRDAERQAAIAEALRRRQEVARQVSPRHGEYSSEEQAPVPSLEDARELNEVMERLGDALRVPVQRPTLPMLLEAVEGMRRGYGEGVDQARSILAERMSIVLDKAFSKPEDALAEFVRRLYPDAKRQLEVIERLNDTGAQVAPIASVAPMETKQVAAYSVEARQVRSEVARWLSDILYPGGKAGFGGDGLEQALEEVERRLRVSPGSTADEWEAASRYLKEMGIPWKRHTGEDIPLVDRVRDLLTRQVEQVERDVASKVRESIAESLVAILYPGDKKPVLTLVQALDEVRVWLAKAAVPGLVDAPQALDERTRQDIRNAALEEAAMVVGFIPFFPTPEAWNLILEVESRIRALKSRASAATSQGHLGMRQVPSIPAPARRPEECAHEDIRPQGDGVRCTLCGMNWVHPAQPATSREAVA